MLANFNPRLRSLLYFLSLVFFIPFSMNAQEGTVTGTVIDQTSKLPMAEVSVSLKGSTIGTTTSGDGKYSIRVPSLKGGTLVFTTIGYGNQEFAIGGKTTIDVSLSTAANNMNEVVVIGYGTASKKRMTGSVASVKAAQLENENPGTVQDLLRGNVSGISVSQSTSAKGGGDLVVRGRTSLRAGFSPLIVLDGVIYQGQLADINPNDIASIDVLKDASSAAVFGAKAASGVVLVTTKRGSSGKPTITLNSNVGFSDLAMDQPLYDGPGFVKWRTDVQNSRFANRKPFQFDDPRNLPSNISVADWLKYDNSAGDPVDVWLNRLELKPIEITNYKNNKTIDWYDLMFQRAFRQDHTVSMSGKKDDFTYYMSLGYTDNEGVIVGDRFKTFRMRVNLEGRIAKFLSVGMNMQFADRDESQVPVNWGQMINASPYGEIYDADGITLRESPNDDLGN
ncbi:MAG: SusC/RagA family TonB-linked outer membrane protein, partial [Chitinophagaceae bacterium]